MCKVGVTLHVLEEVDQTQHLLLQNVAAFHFCPDAVSQSTRCPTKETQLTMNCQKRKRERKREKERERERKREKERERERKRERAKIGGGGSWI